MTLRLIREPSQHNATMGSLYVDGVWQCWTLEDAIRDQKMAGETCIPAGTYRVDITPSQRFHRLLPILLDVPGFSGVRIHPGNTIADTEGCVLVGRTRSSGSVGESRLAFEPLFDRLKAGLSGGIQIVIEPPYEAA